MTERPAPRQPLPSHAKQVFKGEIFDIYQWEQEMFDGTTAIFEKAKRPDTVVVVAITPEGKFLITHEEQPAKPPYISIPAGRMDEGEDALDAAKRELLEETGYVSDSWELWFATQPIVKVDWAIYTFVARGVRKVNEQDLDSGEKIEVETVDFEKFMEVVTQEDFLESQVTVEALRASANPEKMQELKTFFFGN